MNFCVTLIYAILVEFERKNIHVTLNLLGIVLITCSLPAADIAAGWTHSVAVQDGTRLDLGR